MRIDKITEKKIKDSANIVDVVGDFVPLTRSGSEYSGRCPFHDDRHKGSFMVSPLKNIAHCFPCGKTWKPVDFVMDAAGIDYPDALRWLAQKYGIFIDDAPTIPNIRISTPRPPQREETPKRKRLWPTSWIRRFIADDSDAFVRWLYSLPWDSVQRARLPKVLLFYGVGHSHFEDKARDGSTKTHDFTIFWQLDDKNQLHNGHLMKYQPDGHRVKDKDDYSQTWIHARMRRSKTDPFDDNRDEASYCLFGQHLLLACPDATVNIVESEKTAIIMATAYGEIDVNLWMACFGVGNLTNANKLLQPLIEQKKRIVLYPDHDGIERWKKAAYEINYERLTINTEFVQKWWKPEDGDKADVADIILRIMTKGHSAERHHMTSENAIFERMKQKNPAVAMLAEKLNLTPT